MTELFNVNYVHRLKQNKYYEKLLAILLLLTIQLISTNDYIYLKKLVEAAKTQNKSSRRIHRFDC
jgi:hypothetical protein